MQYFESRVERTDSFELFRRTIRTPIVHQDDFTSQRRHLIRDGGHALIEHLNPVALVINGDDDGVQLVSDFVHYGNFSTGNGFWVARSDNSAINNLTKVTSP